MKKPLRVLLTNQGLVHRAGSELYVRDVAIALMRRGYNPVVYSPEPGPVAEDLRKATVPVIHDLQSLSEPPDIIHGQHHLQTAAAIMRFPTVPAVFFCHGWLPFPEQPLAFPSIKYYVAVDDLCRERLLTSGIQPAMIRMIYNFVDLKQFTPRAPLPPRPRNALIFSNAAADNNYAQTIRNACRQQGIDEVSIIGMESGNVQAHPEKILRQHDIVFAKARAALEAMATGCAVIATEYMGCAGMVTPGNMKQLRKLNFGVRTLQAAPVTEESIAKAVAAYNAEEAADVSEWIRQQAGMEQALDQIEEVYHQALAEPMDQERLAGALPGAASRYIQALGLMEKKLCELSALEERCSYYENSLKNIHNSQAWNTVTRAGKIRKWLSGGR